MDGAYLFFLGFGLETIVFGEFQALQLGQDANTPFGFFNGQRCQMCLRSDPLLKVMERLANPGESFGAWRLLAPEEKCVNTVSLDIFVGRGAASVHLGSWEQTCGRHNLTEGYFQVLAELVRGALMFCCDKCQSFNSSKQQVV